MKYLFGNPVSPKEMICDIYHDEREIPDKWLYHGFLLVPVGCDKQILESLDEERKKSTWQKEIHFHGLEGTHSMNDLAVRWIRLFCCSHYKSTYFYLLGVNYANLAKDLWDNKKTRDYKIYNRFFQIGLYGAIKWFFLNERAGFQKVIVNSIFSDAKSRTPQDKFHSRPISEIEFKATIKNEPIIFNCSEVVEVDSNHEDESTHINESHIIQYVDLIVGGLSQVLDATSKHEGKCKVAEILLKYNLPEEIMGYEKTHFESDYYKRYAVSFFPKKKITKSEILNANISTQMNQFYNKRSLQFSQKDQPSLFGEE